MPTSTWHNLDPARRERVLRAAMAEFGRHGYSAGSLNVIAREAGVAKGSLFQYFADKRDLFATVAEDTGLRVRAEMARYLAGPEPGQSFADFLCDALDAWVRYFAKHPLERGVTAATNLEIDPEVRAAVREPVHRLYLDALRPLCELARERGELAPGADLEALLGMLLLLLPHLAIAPFEPALDPVLGLYGSDPPSLREPVRRVVHSLLSGYGVAPTPSR
ncbi:MAG TPA: TetR/AcrR family transcriptional regulator [Pseudonocardiaceae bacterium]